MKTLGMNLQFHPAKLARVNRYRNISQSDFAKLSLEEKCDREQSLRAGGMILAVPNPTIGEWGTPGMIAERHEKTLEILDRTQQELKAAGASDFGLGEIAAWLTYLYEDASEAQLTSFESAFYEDARWEMANENKTPKEWDRERE